MSRSRYSTVAVIVLAVAVVSFIGLIVWVITAGKNPSVLFLVGVPLLGFGAVIAGRIVTNRKHPDG